MTYSEGIERIRAERHRQMTYEGWTEEHDREHHFGELALAAACYALPSQNRQITRLGIPVLWPWHEDWWKPAASQSGYEGRLRELEKAGALIAAEIDRIRAEQASDAEAGVAPSGVGGSE